MRCCRTVLALATFTLVLVSTFLAQQTPTTTVPNLIRYSGTLKDAQSSPLSSSTTGVTFAIYKQQDGGAPVWMETQNVTTDSAGNYTVLLGSTTASGMPADLFLQQEQRWLAVQVQGQGEQARVMLVSVPYAFHATEAERLAGHTVNEFVTTENLQIAVQQQLQQGHVGGATSARTTTDSKGATQPAASQGATNFVDTTTDQVVGVEQDGTGVAVNATALSSSAIVGTTSATVPSGIIAALEGVSSLDSSFGVYGLATSGSSTHPGIGIYGRSNSPNGIGLEGVAQGTGNTIGLIGQASSTSGFAIDATESATTGNTAGMVARIYSPTGIGALILNSASGTVTGSLISARTNAGVQFSVDGRGNVTAAGKYTGNGQALTGIQFSQLLGTLLSTQLTGTYSQAVTFSNLSNAFSGSFTGSGSSLTGINFTQLVGQLGSSQFTGTYSGLVTLSNTSNVLYGDGSHLTGLTPGPGSTYYIQNGSAQQPSSSFNISGNGIAAGTLSGNAINSMTNYQIGGSGVLSIGTAADNNLFVGVGAGASDNPGHGQHNVFVGTGAGQTNTNGVLNTFVGFQSGYSNTTAGNNTFTGYQAGYNITTGANNAFFGVNAGYSSINGHDNSFFGKNAGNSDAGGSFNTFIGADAGTTNTNGNYNTLIGRYAGYSSTTGSFNTFLGEEAGYTNAGGGANTFLGSGAGYSSTTGSNNVFAGFQAGLSNTTGHDNTFMGYKAGYDNTTGVGNVFYGEGAGVNSHSSYNTYMGYYAGNNNTTGHNDVYIANWGPVSGNESNAIRIGGDTNNGYGPQTAAFIEGIYQQSIDAGTGVAVMVDANGKLGTMLSSRRFKEDIRDMGNTTVDLMKLRPVTFFYKPEYNKGMQTLQYGLIAEEVAEVYPELVSFGSDGKPVTVRYQYLAAMLLNEYQKQYRLVEEQTKVVEAQQSRIVTQESQIETQQKQISAQAQQIQTLQQQVQLQNASLQERLNRLEGVVRTQVQTVAESTR